MVKVETSFSKCLCYQIVARAKARHFCKVAGLKCNPELHYASSYLKCLMGDFKIQGIWIKVKHQQM